MVQTDRFAKTLRMVLIGAAIGSTLMQAGCIRTRLMTNWDDRSDGRPVVFRDRFDTDSRALYTITQETDLGHDEYGCLSENNAANVFYFNGKGLYIEAKDNDSVTMSRSIPSMCRGSLTIKFIPKVIYPTNGRIMVVLGTETDGSQYSFELSGGSYEDTLRKEVGGDVSQADTRKGPYFTSTDRLGDYDGEMEIYWKIPDPKQYTLVLNFEPDKAEVILNGQLIRTIMDDSEIDLDITRLSLGVFQLECLITEIEISGR